jgi:hypothetical protein
MLNVAVELRVEDHKRMWVRFDDGVEGVVDVSGLIGRGVFQALSDESVFRGACIDEFGAVCWPGGLDLAPDAMHAALKRNGYWRPGRESSLDAA